MASTPIVPGKPWIVLIKDGSITIRCNGCKILRSVPGTEQQVYDWQTRKQLVQNVFPNVDKELREMLISGTCPDCWNKLWAEPEDEPELTPEQEEQELRQAGYHKCPDGKWRKIPTSEDLLHDGPCPVCESYADREE